METKIELKTMRIEACISVAKDESNYIELSDKATAQLAELKKYIAELEKQLRDAEERGRKQILAFIPEGWTMPLGFSELVAQYRTEARSAQDAQEVK